MGDAGDARSRAGGGTRRKLARIVAPAVALLVGVAAVVLFGGGHEGKAPVTSVSGGGRGGEAPVVSVSGGEAPVASVASVRAGSPRLEPWKVPVTDGPELPSNRIQATLVDKNGEIWFGTYRGGVSRYDPQSNTWKTYTRKDGLANDDVVAIAVGADGALWFGSNDEVEEWRSGSVNRYDPRSNAWKTYGQKDGLPRGTISNITVGADGALWFSMDGSLSRYDPTGNAWNTYTRDNGLPGNVGSLLAAEKDGALWFKTLEEGGARGVGRYEPKSNSWKTYTPKDSLARSAVSAIAVGPDGAFWFVTNEGGVSRFDPASNTWKTYAQQGGLARTHFQPIAVGADGALWFVTSEGGVSRFDPANNAWKTYTQADDLAGHAVRTIAVGADGALWFVMSEGGVRRYDPTSNTWKTYTKKSGLAGNSVGSVAVGTDGALWFTTSEGGVNRYDARRNAWQTYTQNDGLPSYGSGPFRVAPDGALWLVTHRGTSRYDPTSNAWKTYAQGGGLTGNHGGPLAIGADGALWFATDGGRGVNRYDPTSDSWKAYTVNDGLAHNRVQTGAVGADGAVWFGTVKGVSRYDPKKDAWKTYTPEDGLAGHDVRRIAVGTGGALWFVTSEGRVSRYDPTSNAWNSYAVNDGLTSNHAASPAVGADGALWLVTHRGVSRYDPTSNAWKTYTQNDGLAGEHVWTIAVGADGALWFGMRHGGVSRYDPRSNAWRTLTPKDGLASNGIHAMATGPGGALWFLGYKGVERLSFDNATGEAGALLSISPKRSKIAVTSSAIALTRPTGLSFVTPTLPNRFSALSTFPPGATETALARGPGDSTWVATELNGLALRPSPLSKGDTGASSGPDQDLQLTRAEGLPSMTVTALAPVPGTGHAKLWVGTSAGPALVAFERGVLRVEATPKWDGMPTGPVDALAATDDGAVFVAYNAIPANRFLDSKLAARRAKTRVFRVSARGAASEILADEAFAASEIRALAFSAKRGLWAGTSAGLFVTGGGPVNAGRADGDTAKLTAVLAGGRLPPMSIRRLIVAPDEPNTVWMASDRQGDTPPLVVGYRPDTQSVYTLNQDLGVPKGDAIDDLTFTDDGHLVVAVDFELARGRVSVPPS